ncbi:MULTISPECIES: hypothetical protein [unclassified Pseudomonas]|uniref:hypothetical protein n=1 Tax=unclassified Pseudomonas TaxID=196821 RepID=UPI00244B9DD7|nr:MULTISPECIES: hypothetical protein [unclassified Pseudomonas]MDH0897705.1 hypothetical protein [Pseudomonas sp. GD03875]MDH1067863.1 hypothetical protein [Pseudomonas sp. GD03985]
MKILRGFVAGVVQKGTQEKPWAAVGINCVTVDFDGFESTQVVKFMVAGQQYKDGLHNAYRQQIGAEVFAPYRDELDEFNGKVRIRYSLMGVPLRLQDVPEAPAKPAPVPAPAPSTAAKTA